MTTTESNTKPSSTPKKRKMTKNEIVQRLRMVLTKKVPVYAVLGLKKDHLDTIYLVAYNLYIEKKYEKASNLFKLMITLNLLDKKAWMGLAACYQMLGDYKGAIANYYYAGIIDMNDPKPALYVADCYMALKDYASALHSLEIAILFSGDNPQYTVLKKKAEGMRGALAETVKANKEKK